jgi:hypothetical protein
MLDRQYDIQPKVMEVDNELTTQKPKVKAFLEKECIKLEPSARIQRLLRQIDGFKQLHRRELPPEPARHEDLDDHILGEEFRKAERDHLQSHVPMNSWTEVSKNDPEARDAQILDCMWVYVYKFSKPSP